MKSMNHNTAHNKIGQKEKQNQEIRVLHIDDDEAVLYMSKAFIERIGEGKIRVESLHDPTLTLNVLKEDNYDVIVSDYRMSKIDGPKLVDVIEKAGFSIPIIMFTGGERDEDLEKILNSGVDYFVTKGNNVRAQFKELVDVIFEVYKQKEIVNSFLECEKRYSQLIKCSK